MWLCDASSGRGAEVTGRGGCLKFQISPARPVDVAKIPFPRSKGGGGGLQVVGRPAPANPRGTMQCAREEFLYNNSMAFRYLCACQNRLAEHPMSEGSPEPGLGRKKSLGLI